MNKIYIALISMMLLVIKLESMDNSRNQEIAKLEDTIKEYASKAELERMSINELKFELEFIQDPYSPRIRSLRKSILDAEKTAAKWEQTAREARNKLEDLLKNKITDLNAQGRIDETISLEKRVKELEHDKTSRVQEPENPWSIYALYTSVAGTFAAIGLTGTYFYQKFFKRKRARPVAQPHPVINTQAQQATATKP